MKKIFRMNIMIGDGMFIPGGVVMGRWTATTDRMSR